MVDWYEQELKDHIDRVEAERDEARERALIAGQYAQRAVTAEAERDEAWRELSNEIGHHALLKARVAELEQTQLLAASELDWCIGYLEGYNQYTCYIIRKKLIEARAVLSQKSVAQ